MNGPLSYEAYKALLSDQIETSLAKVESRRSRPSVSQNTQVAVWQQTLQMCIDDVLKTADIQAETPVGALVVHPPKNAQLDWNPDYALPAFELARLLRTNPMALASDIAQKTDASKFAKIEAAGPYVNMRLRDDQLIAGLQTILNQGDQFGRLTDGAGKVAIVEYSSPNVAKPFGINHLRATVIGECLARLFDASGFTVLRDNHIGDWGTQFGNLLAAHQQYAPERDFASLSMDELNVMYVRFSQEKKTDPQLVRLGQELFAKLEAGDPELRAKWAAALSMSMDEFNAMYLRLGINFDTQIGEAYFNETAAELVDQLPERGAKDAVVFDTQTKAVYINGEHPVVLRTQDGYCVYAARDLATVEFRQRTYAPSEVIYVVGEEQASYFRTVFDIARKVGLTTLPQGGHMNLEHIGFGLLLDSAGKKLSTRKGTSGKLEDVIDQLDDYAFQETASRNPEMDKELARSIAKKISVGALIWNDLRTDRTSSVRFDIDRMLKLGGGSVIDILYTYSRSCSILQKVAEAENQTQNKSQTTNIAQAFSTETEHQLAVRLLEFGQIIRTATKDRAPHVLVGYLQELTQMHGRFYEESRIQGLDDEALAQLRINLHKAYKTVICNGLTLLNIPVTERI